MAATPLRRAERLIDPKGRIFSIDDRVRRSDKTLRGCIVIGQAFRPHTSRTN